MLSFGLLKCETGWGGPLREKDLGAKRGEGETSQKQKEDKAPSRS